MHFLPRWALVACLPASGVVAYLLLGRTQAGDSRWALLALTVVAAPVVLTGAMAVAVVLSTLLYAFLDDRSAPPTGPSEPAARTERTGAEATNQGTDLRTTSERAAPATGSPSASPGASPAASASASAAP